MDLEMLQVLDGHLDDFRLLDPTSALLHAGRREETGQICEAVVHPVPSSLLDDPVGLGVAGGFAVAPSSARLAALAVEGRVIVILAPDGREIQVPARTPAKKDKKKKKRYEIKCVFVSFLVGSHGSGEDVSHVIPGARTRRAITQ